MASTDKKLVEYINPWGEPQPSAVTGPGNSMSTSNTSTPPPYTTPASPYTTSQIATESTGSSLSTNNPFRRGSQTLKTPIVTSSHRRNPSAGNSPSRGPTPTGTEKFPTLPPHNHALPSHHRRDGSLSGFVDGANDPSRRRSSAADQHLNSPQTRTRRVSSIKERFPGDPTVRPLDMIRGEVKTAHRSPHLRKQHLPGTDTIDLLDAAALKGYHHEGPYDAASLARNTEFKVSPVAALQETNKEAIKATPRENVRDAVEKHRPLDGVARIPSGMRDEVGRLYEYEEGADVLREPGSADAGMGRWPGVDYHPDDVKGKGEPTFSLEREFKARKQSVPTDGAYIELAERPRHRSESINKSAPGVHYTEVGNGEGSSSGAHATTSGAQAHGESYADWEQSRRGSHTGIHRASGEFKRRFGSLRGRKERDGVGA